MKSTGGTVGLVAGSAIIGNVRIDQTTPGTTNAVAATQTTSPWIVAAPTEPCAGSRTFVAASTAAITDTTSTAILASAGGSLRNCVSSVIVTNSHATVGTFVKILDGSTIKWQGYAAPLGGGFSSSFPVPIQGTAATAINCQPVTTGANVICSAEGYTGL